MGNTCRCPAQSVAKIQESSLGLNSEATSDERSLGNAPISNLEPPKELQRSNSRSHIHGTGHINRGHALHHVNFQQGRPSNYTFNIHGKVVWHGIEDETERLSEEELTLVVEPALARLTNSDMIVPTCTDDLLLRAVRGLVNKKPKSEYWRAAVAADTAINTHTAAFAESIDRIIRFRVDIGANTILNRRLHRAEEFHRLWPVFLCGADVDGHPVFCEQLSMIQTQEILQRFSISEVNEFRFQVHELIQHITAREGLKHGKLLSKHVHVVDLSGISINEFRKTASSVKPIFSMIEDQCPNSLRGLYLVNAPGMFRFIWQIVKLWLDKDTVLIIHIEGAYSNQLRDDLREQGIIEDALPAWIGGSAVSVPLINIINDIIDNGGPGGNPGLSGELTHRIDSILQKSPGLPEGLPLHHPSPNETVPRDGDHFEQSEVRFLSEATSFATQPETGHFRWTVQNSRSTYAAFLVVMPMLLVVLLKFLLFDSTKNNTAKACGFPARCL